MDFQVDYSIFSGLALDENYNAYLISGGSPASVGRDPSPTMGEVLLLPDRGASTGGRIIDLRGDVLPNPACERRQHRRWGLRPLRPYLLDRPHGSDWCTRRAFRLSRGFLLYLNRTRNTAVCLSAERVCTRRQRCQRPDPFLDFDLKIK
jgi:hypothetical protein